MSFDGLRRLSQPKTPVVLISGIDEVAVLTQCRPRSLVNHIGAGRPWGLDTLDGSIQMLQPYLGRADMDWYQGTADAVYQNPYVLSLINI